MWGAVPPPTTATPAENALSKKKLLWGAVLPPTMTAEVFIDDEDEILEKTISGNYYTLVL